MVSSPTQYIVLGLSVSLVPSDLNQISFIHAIPLTKSLNDTFRENGQIRAEIHINALWMGMAVQRALVRLCYVNENTIFEVAVSAAQDAGIEVIE